MARSVKDLAPGESAIIRDVALPSLHYPLSAEALLRLQELGFLPGEPVTLVRRGPGGDPLACRIGTSLFALRQVEAGSVLLED
jgi:ferrous iron transport protein A